MRVVVLALVLLTLGLAVPGLGERDFWPPDEARYGQIARELGSPSWVIPTLNDEVYYDKPVVWFWLVRGVAWFSGQVDESAARWPSVLGALLMVACVTWAAGRAAGSYAGLASGLCLLTSALFVWHSRTVNLDMALGGCVSACLLGWFSAFESGRASKLALGFIWLGLGLLIKGPHAALVLPVFLVWKFSARSPDHPDAKFGRAFGLGFLLFFLLTGLFAGLVYREGGLEYLRTLTIDRGLRRIEGALAHEQPWWFFGPRWLSGFAPWCLLLLAWIFPSHYRGLDRSGRRLGGFALVWIVVWLLVLSLIPGKRSLYLIPILPAASLLVGLAVASLAKHKSGMPKLLLALTLLVLSLALTLTGGLAAYAGLHAENLRDLLDRMNSDLFPWAGRLPDLWSRLGLVWPTDGSNVDEFVRHLRLFGWPTVLGGLWTLWTLIRRGPSLAFEWATFTAIAAFSLAAAVLLPHLDAEQSRRPLGASVSRYAALGEVAMFRHLDEGVLWYYGSVLPVIGVSPSQTALPDSRASSQPATSSAPTSQPDAAAGDSKPSSRPTIPWAAHSQKLKEYLQVATPRYCLVRASDMREVLESGVSLEEGVDFTRIEDISVGHDKPFVWIANRTAREARK